MIQFRFNPVKALQAIQWMLETATEPLDFHTILKTAYFSDKQMLAKHSRPIFGAAYRAMNYGPVPLEIYEMLKCEPYWLTELQRDEFPWAREGYRVRLSPRQNSLVTPQDIAPAELDIIRDKFAMCRAMSFTERTRETHGMDWVEGTRRPGERMAYEDMIASDHPGRADLIEDLQTTGPRLVL